MDNEQLFLDMLERDEARIFRICLSYASDTDDAKDLFQESMIQAWKALPSFRQESSLGTWVFRIVLNVCIRARQKASRQNRFMASYKPALETISITMSVGDKRYSELYKCIGTLQDTDRSLILLFLEDIPYKEIADIVGISENYVAVKIKRIKEKLFTCLKNEL